jgi:hypothetical protein
MSSLFSQSSFRCFHSQSFTTRTQVKKIVICLCFGGDIQESIRADVTGYIKSNEKINISFEEWNGDKLASLIFSNFLQEDLIPEYARSQLRKSLALLDEPDASYGHFSVLLKAFSNLDDKNDKNKLKAIRQIAVCLWILYAWARDAVNLESAYLSSELSLLHAWSIAKPYILQQNKIAKEIQDTYSRILYLHLQIANDFVDNKIFPHVTKRHALSMAARGSNSLDINLKLFDILGRLALSGIWSYWLLAVMSEENPQDVARLQGHVVELSNAIKHLVGKNPILLLPVKDAQVIDISIALLLLMADSENKNEILNWFAQIVERANFSYLTNGPYPCNLYSYADLVEHPQAGDKYRRKVTGGSVLFPMIALAAALLEHKELYEKIQILKNERLDHCNFQFWYPDDSTEEHLYQNSGIHGATLSHVRIDLSMDKFIEQVFGECEESPQFHSLSAVQANQWPLVLVACRHYRLPVPLHLWKSLWESPTSIEN